MKIGGQKAAGKGKIKGEAAKKALGEALEPLAASLTKGVNESGVDGPKGKRTNKKDKKHDPAKEVKKDIKAPLGPTVRSTASVPARMRDRAGKATEAALQITSLRIGHQEARPSLKPFDAAPTESSERRVWPGACESAARSHRAFQPLGIKDSVGIKF